MAIIENIILTRSFLLDLQLPFGVYSTHLKASSYHLSFSTKTGQEPDFALPVDCNDVNAVSPVLVAQNNPCPGGVYCEHYRCGQASAVPGGIFIPIFAHVDVTKIAMTLGLIATHISGAINTVTFNKIKNEEKEEKMKKLFFCLTLIVLLTSCAVVKDGPFIVGKPYGGPAPYGDGIHPGIDYDINTGTPIIAASDGKVIHTAVSPDGIENGMLVVVTHETHFYTIYVHLSKVVVQKGQLLKRGQLIGLSGASNNYNRKDYQHLHFGVCKFGTPDCRFMANVFDPKKFWLGGQPQCFDPKMDYSVYSQKDITLPIACGDYSKALIEESKGKQ